MQQPPAPPQSPESNTAQNAPAPTTPNSATPATPKGAPTMLTQFCTLVQTFEGYVLPGEMDGNGHVWPHGSPAYINKNPGNLRCIVGDEEDWNMLASGTSTNPANFCVFPTYEAGFQGLLNVVKAVCLGNAEPNGPYGLAAKKSGLVNSSQLTILQYFGVRDPASDGNNPAEFAAFIGKGLGVDSSTFRMCQLVQ